MRYETARKAFALQTDGKLSMEETFLIAGEQTRGLPLRVAIDYAMEEMPFVDGYDQLMASLRERRIQLVINSTGYTVTHYAIRYGARTPPFHIRCNRLLFAEKSGRILGEDEWKPLSARTSRNLGRRSKPSMMRSAGHGAGDPGYSGRGGEGAAGLGTGPIPGDPNCPGGPHGGHHGRQHGHSCGGPRRWTGAAFNYNQALETFLVREGREELQAGRIVLVDPKGRDCHLEHILPLLS